MSGKTIKAKLIKTLNGTDIFLDCLLDLKLLTILNIEDCHDKESKIKGITLNYEEKKYFFDVCSVDCEIKPYEYQRIQKILDLMKKN